MTKRRSNVATVGSRKDEAVPDQTTAELPPARVDAFLPEPEESLPPPTTVNPLEICANCDVKAVVWSDGKSANPVGWCLRHVPDNLRSRAVGARRPF